jgi:hypothetical protein
MAWAGKKRGARGFIELPVCLFNFSLLQVPLFSHHLTTFSTPCPSSSYRR